MPQGTGLGVDAVALDNGDSADLRVLDVVRLAGADRAGADELAVDVVAMVR